MTLKMLDDDMNLPGEVLYLLCGNFENLPVDESVDPISVAVLLLGASSVGIEVSSGMSNLGSSTNGACFGIEDKT